MTWLLGLLGLLGRNVPRWVMWVGVGLLAVAAVVLWFTIRDRRIAREAQQRLIERIRNRQEIDDEKARKARDDAGSGSDRANRLRKKYDRAG